MRLNLQRLFFIWDSSFSNICSHLCNNLISFSRKIFVLQMLATMAENKIKQFLQHFFTPCVMYSLISICVLNSMNNNWSRLFHPVIGVACGSCMLMVKLLQRSPAEWPGLMGNKRCCVWRYMEWPHMLACYLFIRQECRQLTWFPWGTTNMSEYYLLGLTDWVKFRYYCYHLKEQFSSAV